MTSAVLGAPATSLPPPRQPRRALPVLPVAHYLDAQQTLTAVERFAKAHEVHDPVRQKKHYRDLIPLSEPGPGQQYAFEVDLDACTGCKACVSACHTLNGLDEGELWRTTGLLHGGVSGAPAQQTVTTSCHHCLEPACMLGCPTQAYEKDPLTGIVKHLDDQCFGCQYCTLMCPYDAPKYNKERGIVRKCDMCSSRLQKGEAPACVQACPNQAISIKLADQANIVEVSDAGHFLPGAPTPEQTLPTTTYKTERRLPNNLLPADFYAAKTEHSHPPLVAMLTLTQLSVGAFALDLLVGKLSGSGLGHPLLQAVVAGTLGLLALCASVLHLGRPHLAWRAVLGLRTSWLSREALAFGLFVALAVSYSVSKAAPLLRQLGAPAALSQFEPFFQAGAALAGLLGVACSIMVYVATKRAQWSGSATGIKFLGTTVVLGASVVFGVWSAAPTGGYMADPRAPVLLWFVLGASGVKLSYEIRGLLYARARQNSAFKRMARVMLGDLAGVTKLRFFTGVAGGLVLPLLLLSGAVPPRLTTFFALHMLLLVLLGEATERYLFFRAAPASRMPGGLR